MIQIWKLLIKLQVVEETYNCSEECEALDKSIDQNQLAYRLIKLRIRVLRANIGKLLCICVPERDKWKEFGWDGKTVDDILEELSRIDIPVRHPGNSECQYYVTNNETYNPESNVKTSNQNFVKMKNSRQEDDMRMPSNINENEFGNVHQRNEISSKVRVIDIDKHVGKNNQQTD